MKLFDSFEKGLSNEELVDNLVAYIFVCTFTIWSWSENFVHICLKHLGAKNFTSYQKFVKIYEGREKLSLWRKYNDWMLWGLVWRSLGLLRKILKNDNVRNIEFPMRLVLMISSLFLVILMVSLKRGEQSVEQDLCWN